MAATHDDVTDGGRRYDDCHICANDGGADTISDFEYLRDYLVFQRNLNGSGITSFSTMAARASQVGIDDHDRPACLGEYDSDIGSCRRLWTIDRCVGN